MIRRYFRYWLPRDRRELITRGFVAIYSTWNGYKLGRDKQRLKLRQIDDRGLEDAEALVHLARRGLPNIYYDGHSTDRALKALGAIREFTKS